MTRRINLPFAELVIMDDPYSEGQEARRDGVPYLCNPYSNDITITNPLQWAQGWMNEDEQLRFS